MEDEASRPAAPLDLDNHDPAKDLVPIPSTVVSPRLWPAIVVIVLQWGALIGFSWAQPGSLPHFLSMLLAPLLATLAIFVWWLFFSRVPWRERLIIVGAFILSMVLGGCLIHSTLLAGLLFYTLPTTLTVAVSVLVMTSVFSWRRRCGLVALSMFASVLPWCLLRSGGMDGSMNTDFAWRWSSTTEQKFLDALAVPQRTGAEPAATVKLAIPTVAEEGDWPEFRGPRRDGVVHHVVLSTDWAVRPPRELWRRAVGPAWSSFAVIDQYAFTQEQRGPIEVVVCYESETGQQCWVNETQTRFDEAVSGAGPRATPTFWDGQLFTTGATGIVQCLDASTGRTVWSRDLQQDTGAELPVWGFASSPLIVGEVVIVFAGGPSGKSVVGYDRRSGAIVWTSGKGRLSYSSPQLAELNQQQVVLMLSELGMEVYDPAQGRLMWTYDWAVKAMRIIQPQVLDGGRLILGEDYSGCRLLRVDLQPSGWTSEDLWSSRQIKPYFNDFVVFDGFCYGFDGKIFTCIDAADGVRRWKGGRYGFGQVLLLEDMAALLLLAESGDLVLLQATPDKLTELSRIPAISGKTWNHPVIARGKLFVRNGEEAACFELPLDSTAAPTAPTGP